MNNKGEIGALAAIVSHELNNIAVPMAGFTDLAIENSENESLAQHLRELKVAIERISALAFDLETLGESQSVFEVVSIGSCIPKEEFRRSPDGWQLLWDCGPGTSVNVDPLQAQRAISAMVSLACPQESQSRSKTLVTICRQSAPVRECVACKAPIPLKQDTVFVQVAGARPISAEAFSHPLMSARGIRVGGRKLICAVLVHCAHAAGGHLVLDESETLVSLLLPAP